MHNIMQNIRQNNVDTATTNESILRLTKYSFNSSKRKILIYTIRRHNIYSISNNIKNLNHCLFIHLKGFFILYINLSSKF